MSGFKRYDEEFKLSLINLYQTGKTGRRCGDDGETNSIITKANAQLEEENLILKKASAILMQNSK